MDLAAFLRLDTQGLAVFLLVLVRASAIFLIAPVLGNANTPARVKVALSFMIAMILTPVLLQHPRHLAVSTVWELAYLIFQEALLGLFIGFLAQLLFVAVEFAGQMVGIQMGFSMANMFDPQSHAQVAVTAQFYLFLGVMVFLGMNGHLWMIQALVHSFDVIPLGGFHFDSRAIGTLMLASDELFWIALTLMAPVLGVLALAEVAMAIVARIMPQMNIFVASFPVKVGLGIMTMALSFPLMIGSLGEITQHTFGTIWKFLGPG